MQRQLWHGLMLQSSRHSMARSPAYAHCILRMDVIISALMLVSERNQPMTFAPHTLCPRHTRFAEQCSQWPHVTGSSVT